MARAPAALPVSPGSDELILPGIVPRHLRSQPEFVIEGVSNDVYNVANRIAEINSRLFIQCVYNRATGDKWFAIMEQVGPEEEQLVFKSRVLDGRVVEQVAYLVKVPVAQRAKEAIARAEKFEDEEKEREKDDLVERLGLPMLRDLRECGFLGEYGKGSGVSVPRPRFGQR